MWNVHRPEHYWKHNRSITNPSEESSDDATPGLPHRRNPDRTLLPTSSSGNTCFLSLSSRSRTLQHQQRHLLPTLTALDHIPAGAPLRLATAARGERGNSILVHCPIPRPFLLPTLRENTRVCKSLISLRISPDIPDTLLPPAASYHQP